MKWISEPVVVDEASGIAIFNFASAGIAWLHEHSDFLISFGADTESLETFANTCSANIYAVDTF